MQEDNLIATLILFGFFFLIFLVSILEYSQHQDKETLSQQCMDDCHISTSDKETTLCEEICYSIPCGHLTKEEAGKRMVCNG
jgi:hypothetical protein